MKIATSSTKTFFKLLIYQLLFILSFFVILELSLRFFFGYKESYDGDTSCKVFHTDLNYSTYKINCKISEKHWENDRWIDYQLNQYGRREINQKPEGEKIAIFGDSFTFGLMVPIKHNYQFFAKENLFKKKYTIHNYGVSGEQLDHIFNKLSTINLDEYDHVIYGLTPNDFFDYLKGDIKTEDSNFQKVKKLLLSTSLSRFMLHESMSIDQIYYNTYKSREPYSGYLESKLNKEWLEATNNLNTKINKLPKKVKNKLKIFLLPQKAEVVSYRLGKYNDAYKNEILKICYKSKINCKASNVPNLASIHDSHFPVDGHLTIKGNHSVAKDFADWVNNWN